MPFDIVLVAGPSITDEPELERVALPFLNMVGYLPVGYDPRTGVETVLESVPYRLFAECFLGHLDKVWSVGELARSLSTSIPTVYRHIAKLESLDILGQGALDNDQSRKGYFFRYHDLAQAWKFTEVNVELTLDAYRKVVELIQAAAGKSKKEDAGEKSGLKSESDFSMRVTNRRFSVQGKWELLAAEFLHAIDYLSDPPEPRKIKESVPFRLLADCLMKRPDSGWSIDELSVALETTKPTIYRNLKKLGRLGLLEKSVPEDISEETSQSVAARSPPKRRYRIRRGNLSKAWNTTEMYSRAVMKSYRRTVDHLSSFGKH